MALSPSRSRHRDSRSSEEKGESNLSPHLLLCLLVVRVASLSWYVIKILNFFEQELPHQQNASPQQNKPHTLLGTLALLVPPVMVIASIKGLALDATRGQFGTKVLQRAAVLVPAACLLLCVVSGWPSLVQSTDVEPYLLAGVLVLHQEELRSALPQLLFMFAVSTVLLAYKAVALAWYPDASATLMHFLLLACCHLGVLVINPTISLLLAQHRATASARTGGAVEADGGSRHSAGSQRSVRSRHRRNSTRTRDSSSSRWSDSAAEPQAAPVSRASQQQSEMLRSLLATPLPQLGGALGVPMSPTGTPSDEVAAATPLMMLCRATQSLASASEAPSGSEHGGGAGARCGYRWSGSGANGGSYRNLPPMGRDMEESRASSGPWGGQHSSRQRRMVGDMGSRPGSGPGGVQRLPPSPPVAQAFDSGHMYTGPGSQSLLLQTGSSPLLQTGSSALLQSAGSQLGTVSLAMALSAARDSVGVDASCHGDQTDQLSEEAAGANSKPCPDDAEGKERHDSSVPSEGVSIPEASEGTPTGRALCSNSALGSDRGSAGPLSAGAEGSASFRPFPASPSGPVAIGAPVAAGVSLRDEPQSPGATFHLQAALSPQQQQQQLEGSGMSQRLSGSASSLLSAGLPWPGMDFVPLAGVGVSGLHNSSGAQACSLVAEGPSGAYGSVGLLDPDQHPFDDDEAPPAGAHALEADVWTDAVPHHFASAEIVKVEGFSDPSSEQKLLKDKGRSSRDGRGDGPAGNQQQERQQQDSISGGAGGTDEMSTMDVTAASPWIVVGSELDLEAGDQHAELTLDIEPTLSIQQQAKLSVVRGEPPAGRRVATAAGRPSSRLQPGSASSSSSAPGRRSAEGSARPPSMTGARGGAGAKAATGPPSVHGKPTASVPQPTDPGSEIRAGSAEPLLRIQEGDACEPQVQSQPTVEPTDDGEAQWENVQVFPASSGRRSGSSSVGNSVATTQDNGQPDQRFGGLSYTEYKGVRYYRNVEFEARAAAAAQGAAPSTMDTADTTAPSSLTTAPSSLSTGPASAGPAAIKGAPPAAARSTLAAATAQPPPQGTLAQGLVPSVSPEAEAEAQGLLAAGVRVRLEPWFCYKIAAARAMDIALLLFEVALSASQLLPLVVANQTTAATTAGQPGAAEARPSDRQSHHRPVGLPTAEAAVTHAALIVLACCCVVVLLLNGIAALGEGPLYSAVAVPANVVVTYTVMGARVLALALRQRQGRGAVWSWAILSALVGIMHLVANEDSLGAFMAQVVGMVAAAAALHARAEPRSTLVALPYMLLLPLAFLAYTKLHVGRWRREDKPSRRGREAAAGAEGAGEAQMDAGQSGLAAEDEGQGRHSRGYMAASGMGAARPPQYSEDASARPHAYRPGVSMEWQQVPLQQQHQQQGQHADLKPHSEPLPRLKGVSLEQIMGYNAACELEEQSFSPYVQQDDGRRSGDAWSGGAPGHPMPPPAAPLGPHAQPQHSPLPDRHSAPQQPLASGPSGEDSWVTAGGTTSSTPGTSSHPADPLMLTGASGSEPERSQSLKSQDGQWPQSEAQEDTAPRRPRTLRRCTSSVASLLPYYRWQTWVQQPQLLLEPKPLSTPLEVDKEEDSMESYAPPPAAAAAASTPAPGSGTGRSSEGGTGSKQPVAAGQTAPPLPTGSAPLMSAQSRNGLERLHQLLAKQQRPAPGGARQWPALPTWQQQAPEVQQGPSAAARGGALGILNRWGLPGMSMASRRLSQSRLSMSSSNNTDLPKAPPHSQQLQSQVSRVTPPHSPLHEVQHGHQPIPEQYPQRRTPPHSPMPGAMLDGPPTGYMLGQAATQPMYQQPHMDGMGGHASYSLPQVPGAYATSSLVDGNVHFAHHQPAADLSRSHLAAMVQHAHAPPALQVACASVPPLPSHLAQMMSAEAEMYDNLLSSVSSPFCSVSKQRTGGVGIGAASFSAANNTDAMAHTMGGSNNGIIIGHGDQHHGLSATALHAMHSQVGDTAHTWLQHSSGTNPNGTGATWGRHASGPVTKPPSGGLGGFLYGVDTGDWQMHPWRTNAPPHQGPSPAPPRSGAAPPSPATASNRWSGGGGGTASDGHVLLPYGPWSQAPLPPAPPPAPAPAAPPAADPARQQQLLREALAVIAGKGTSVHTTIMPVSPAASSSSSIPPPRVSTNSTAGPAQHTATIAAGSSNRAHHLSNQQQQQLHETADSGAGTATSSNPRLPFPDLAPGTSSGIGSTGSSHLQDSQASAAGSANRPYSNVSALHFAPGWQQLLLQSTAGSSMSAANSPRHLMGTGSSAGGGTRWQQTPPLPQQAHRSRHVSSPSGLTQGGDLVSPGGGSMGAPQHQFLPEELSTASMARNGGGNNYNNYTNSSTALAAFVAAMGTGSHQSGRAGQSPMDMDTITRLLMSSSAEPGSLNGPGGPYYRNVDGATAAAVAAAAAALDSSGAMPAPPQVSTSPVASQYLAALLVQQQEQEQALLQRKSSRVAPPDASTSHSVGAAAAAGGSINSMVSSTSMTARSRSSLPSGGAPYSQQVHQSGSSQATTAAGPRPGRSSASTSATGMATPLAGMTVGPISEHGPADLADLMMSGSGPALLGALQRAHSHHGLGAPSGGGPSGSAPTPSVTPPGPASGGQRRHAGDPPQATAGHLPFVDPTGSRPWTSKQLEQLQLIQELQQRRSQEQQAAAKEEAEAHTVAASAPLPHLSAAAVIVAAADPSPHLQHHSSQRHQASGAKNGRMTVAHLQSHTASSGSGGHMPDTALLATDSARLGPGTVPSMVSMGTPSGSGGRMGGGGGSVAMSSGNLASGSALPSMASWVGVAAGATTLATNVTIASGVIPSPTDGSTPTNESLSVSGGVQPNGAAATPATLPLLLASNVHDDGDSPNGSGGPAGLLAEASLLRSGSQTGSHKKVMTASRYEGSIATAGSDRGERERDRSSRLSRLLPTATVAPTRSDSSAATAGLASVGSNAPGMATLTMSESTPSPPATATVAPRAPSLKVATGSGDEESMLSALEALRAGARAGEQPPFFTGLPAAAAQRAAWTNAAGTRAPQQQPQPDYLSAPPRMDHHPPGASTHLNRKVSFESDARSPGVSADQQHHLQVFGLPFDPWQAPADIRTTAASPALASQGSVLAASMPRGSPRAPGPGGLGAAPAAAADNTRYLVGAGNSSGPLPEVGEINLRPSPTFLMRSVAPNQDLQQARQQPDSGAADAAQQRVSNASSSGFPHNSSSSSSHNNAVATLMHSMADVSLGAHLDAQVGKMAVAAAPPPASPGARQLRHSTASGGPGGSSFARRSVAAGFVASAVAVADASPPAAGPILTAGAVQLQQAAYRPSANPAPNTSAATATTSSPVATAPSSRASVSTALYKRPLTSTPEADRHSVGSRASIMSDPAATATATTTNTRASVDMSSMSSKRSSVFKSFATRNSAAAMPGSIMSTAGSVLAASSGPGKPVAGAAQPAQPHAAASAAATAQGGSGSVGAASSVTAGSGASKGGSGASGKWADKLLGKLAKLGSKKGGKQSKA